MVKAGLSPYTRGIPLHELRREEAEGSIPVHTGNTSRLLILIMMVRVYPRTHGEYEYLGGGKSMVQGLSPYTRGIPLGKFLPLFQVGSIPVHTGNTCCSA